MTNGKKLNLYQKINEIQKLVTTVFKNGEVQITPTRKYSATLHDDVTSLVQGPVAEIGIVFFPSIVNSELERFETIKNYNGQETKSLNYLIKLWIDVKVVNSDDKKDFEIIKTFIYAIDSGDKAQGKALSMGVKNVYLKLFMMKSEDNEESRPDGNFSQPNNSQGSADKPSEKHLNAMYYKVKDNGCGLADFNDTLKPNASMNQYKWLMDNFSKENFDKLIIKLKG